MTSTSPSIRSGNILPKYRLLCSMVLDSHREIELLLNSILDAVKKKVKNFSYFAIYYATSPDLKNIAQGNGFVLPKTCGGLFEIIHVNPKLFEGLSDECIKFVLSHEIIHAVKNEIEDSNFLEKIAPTLIRLYSTSEIRCSNNTSQITSIIQEMAKKGSSANVTLKDIIDKLPITNKVEKINRTESIENAGYICTIFNHLTRHNSDYDESVEVDCDKLGSKSLGYDSTKTLACLGEIKTLCENEGCRELISNRMKLFLIN